MPDLPQVTEKFEADVTAYLAAMDEIIAKAEEVARVVQASEEALLEFARTADDAALLLEPLAARMNDVRTAAAEMGGAAGTAAGGLNDLRNSAVTLTGADSALFEATVRLDDVLDDQMISAGAAANRLNDLRNAAAGAALADGVLAGAAGVASKAADTQAVAADRAGVRILGWGRVTATAIHWIISGSAELLAVLIPATVAAGAWAAVWVQGATNVYDHMQAVYGATEAMANITHTTAGQVLGLGDALQKAQNAANPDVYQALGGAINLVKESSGGLATVGLEVGKIFDTFVAKLVYDFSAAGHAGQTLGDLLHAMIPDLVGVGQFFGNLGAALANFAAQMPGLAEVLLHLLDVITGGAKDVIEFAGQFRIAGFSILTVVMAFEEFNRWGSLLVGLLGRMGLATSTVEGGFLSMGRASGVFMNLFRVIPMAVATLVSNLGSAMTGFGRFDGAIAQAGYKVRAFGADMTDGIMAIGPGSALALTAIGVGLGILIDKLVTARSSAQQFADSLQQTAEKASNLSVLAVIGANLSALQDKINASRQATDALTKSVNDNASATLDEGKAQHSLQEQQRLAAQAQSQYHAGQVQQIQDAGNVVTGANQIARAFGISVPAAMALAQQAGVNLTGQVMNAKGQWTALGQKVHDAYAGFEAMGQASGAVGNDILALAIQTGEAGTKMSQLNQAWDSWMQTVTGGTSGMGALSESLQNLGLKAASSSNNLATASTFTEKSMAKFADSLQTYTGKGAQAWQNFDQVVGSTAPQLIDWLRTAGTMGAVSGKQIQQAGLDMVAGLVPLAAKSKAAQTELLTLAQNAGDNVTTFGGLEKQVKDTHASMDGLAGIVDTTTTKLGDMATAAQNLGTVMNSAMTTAMSQAALKASGFYQAQVQLTNAIKQFGANSPQAEAAAKRLTDDWNKAQQMAGEVAKEAGAAQNAIDRMHGKNITIGINTNYTSTGTPISTYGPQNKGASPAQGATGGFVTGPGTSTSDSINARLSHGEFVMQAAAVEHWGRATLDAMNAKTYAAGGMIGGAGSPAPALQHATISGGGGIGQISLTSVSNLKLDNQTVATAQRKDVLTYGRRNPGSNWDLRVR